MTSQPMPDRDPLGRLVLLLLVLVLADLCITSIDLVGHLVRMIR